MMPTVMSDATAWMAMRSLMRRLSGMASVGLVSLLGNSACLIAALGTLPAALQVWSGQRHYGECG